MKKGFTLIELLAVITILSIIVLITSISVTNLLKDSKEDLTTAQLKAIEESAKSWSADNIDDLPSNNSCSFITLKDLKDDGLLDSSIINPKDKKEISNDLKIKIISKINGNGNSILSYEVNSDDISNCTYIGSSIYVDVPQGLTPVIYDGENWKVPELNQEWYNYDKQMWANAVVLGSGKTKKPGDVVTVEGDKPDALMMLVYIPRYEYKIEGQYGTHTDGTPGTAELPGEIKVKFVNISKTIADDGYILHPAFNFDGEKSGFWVGKFELSHTILSSSNVNNNLGCKNESDMVTCTVDVTKFRVLPNVVSLRNNDVSNFWYAIKNIENESLFNLKDMDIHMIKNSEWGAITYLSQSKYGKYGNNDYEGAQREVYQNKSGQFITGSSNGTPSQTTIYGQCTYNQKAGTSEQQDKNHCGPGASTTGNIYGIYDMSGGAVENVMAVYEYNGLMYSGYTMASNSGFNGVIGYNNQNKNDGLDYPESKYYNKYVNEINANDNTNIESCNINETCYGHGIFETKEWYQDDAYILDSYHPLLSRGGFYISGFENGIFNFNISNGNGGSGISTRFVGIVK